MEQTILISKVNSVRLHKRKRKEELSIDSHTNASLRGKNTFAKMVEGRKQQTYFCPALMTC